MINLDTQREAVTRAARTVADTTVSAGVKAKEIGVSTVKTVNDSPVTTRFKDFGTSAASTATDTAKSIFAKAQSATGKGVEKVGGLPLGDKKVGERAQETVDTVQEKIDVEQIQDQVAKLRDQIESVLGSWKDSFRPSTRVKETSDPVDKPAKKAAATTKKTTTAKSSTAKKTATAKTSTTKKPAGTKKSTPKASGKPSSTK